MNSEFDGAMGAQGAGKVPPDPAAQERQSEPTIESLKQELALVRNDLTAAQNEIRVKSDVIGVLRHSLRELEPVQEEAKQLRAVIREAAGKSPWPGPGATSDGAIAIIASLSEEITALRQTERDNKARIEGLVCANQKLSKHYDALTQKSERERELTDHYRKHIRMQDDETTDLWKQEGMLIDALFESTIAVHLMFQSCAGAMMELNAIAAVADEAQAKALAKAREILSSSRRFIGELDQSEAFRAAVKLSMERERHKLVKWAIPGMLACSVALLAAYGLYAGKGDGATKPVDPSTPAAAPPADP